MIDLTVSEFTDLVAGQASSPTIADVSWRSPKISGFALDSREVKRGDLFIAIKGEKVDGHDYAELAAKQGAVVCLAERPVVSPHILVPNVVAALGQFARYERAKFEGPVVGVTGSAGKTTTKELIAAALSPLGPVLKTEGNRNSEFSSPLIWAELTPETKSVVVEMGMRGFGQIEYLASFTKPTIGVITNIGHSHIELVGSREGVAKAKAELLAALPTNGHAVLWAEDPFLEMLAETSEAPVSTFGFSERADCQIVDYSAVDWSRSYAVFQIGGTRYPANLPAAGRHIALNAAAAMICAELAGASLIESAAALQHAEFPPMRMEIVEFAGATIVLDAYNASPSSVIAALETLQELPAKRRVAILGEMRELGNYSEEGHRKVGEALARNEVDLAVLLGEPARWIGSGAQLSGMAASDICYVDSLQEITEFLKTLRAGDVALIKGSRAIEMERALEGLKEPSC